MQKVISRKLLQTLSRKMYSKVYDQCSQDIFYDQVSRGTYQYTFFFYLFTNIIDHKHLLLTFFCLHLLGAQNICSFDLSLNYRSVHTFSFQEHEDCRLRALTFIIIIVTSIFLYSVIDLLHFILLKKESKSLSSLFLLTLFTRLIS